MYRIVLNVHEPRWLCRLRYKATAIGLLTTRRCSFCIAIGEPQLYTNTFRYQEYIFSKITHIGKQRNIAHPPFTHHTHLAHPSHTHTQHHIHCWIRRGYRRRMWRLRRGQFRAHVSTSRQHLAIAWSLQCLSFGIGPRNL